MATPHRNQLVWLSAVGWHAIRAADWDAQAAEILRHWESADLPLVVARQRAEVADNHLCLGLPAPTAWGRRRLSLDVHAGDVCRTARFPTLSQVIPEDAWMNRTSLPALARPLHVYGSFGWQAITGLDYVHAASDLDVLVHADNLEVALQAATSLSHWDAPWRVDGEVVLPDGHAVAWRELLQASQGTVAHVLVKHRKFAALMTLDGLQDALGFPATRPQELSINLA